MKFWSAFKIALAVFKVIRKPHDIEEEQFQADMKDFHQRMSEKHDRKHK